MPGGGSCIRGSSEISATRPKPRMIATATVTSAVRRTKFKIVLGYPGSTGQTLTLHLNGHTFGPSAVHDSWETVEFATGADVWRSGVNRLRLDFSSTHTPAEVGLGADARPLAAAVDYVRVAVSEAGR